MILNAAKGRAQEAANRMHCSWKREGLKRPQKMKEKTGLVN